MMEDSTIATSWSLECVQTLVESEGVIKVDFDSCMPGMKVGNDVGEALVRTRIGMLTNSVPVAEALRTMPYQGGHRQVQLMSGEVKSCEVYTDKFCEAVCVANRHDRNQLQMGRNHVMNMTEMKESMPTPHEAVEPCEIF